MGYDAVKEVNLVLKHGVEAKNYDDVRETYTYTMYKIYYTVVSIRLVYM